MSLLLGLLMWSQHYFVDGITLRLENGTLIQTTEKVTEDREQYSWWEDGVFVAIPKTWVVSVSYFSMMVPGRQPRGVVKTQAMRRISGRPVFYKSEGELYLKVRHVDSRGRSAEGNVIPNRVDVLKRRGEPDSQSHRMEAVFEETRPGYRVTFKFYDLKGGLVYQRFLNTDTDLGGKKTKKRKKRRGGNQNWAFDIPVEVNLESLGLVEVVNEAL